MNLGNTFKLDTETFTLRCLKEEDYHSIAEACNDETIHEYIGTPYPYTEEDAKEYIEDSLEKWNKRETYNFAVEINGKIAGMVGLMDISKLHRRAEIGYWLSKNYRGRGIMREAVDHVVTIAFQELELLRVYARVDDDNPKSSNLLLSLGFVEEGRFRSHRVRNGERKDEIHYGILREEK